MMPLGRRAFDVEILSFDVTETAQFAEKCAPCGPATGFGEEAGWNGRMEDRNPGRRSALLRP
jgi:hypothetical protein